jgi:hypothetical protein
MMNIPLQGTGAAGGRSWQPAAIALNPPRLPSTYLGAAQGPAQAARKFLLTRSPPRATWFPKEEHPMVQSFRPAFLTLALLIGAAPAFAQGTSTGTPAPAAGSTQRPVAAAPASPTNPGGQVTARPATPAQGTVQGSAVQGTAQAPARPAQPSGTAATTPAPTAPRTN